MRRPSAFTLVEAVALFVVLIFLIAIALAILPLSRRSPHHGRRGGNNSQLRGIHQAMVMYAQGNGGHFPGLDLDGEDKAVTVEERLQILLEANYFTGEYAVSPSESKAAWTTGTLTTAHYSYAMLQLPPEGDRRAEWRETLNTEAVALGDRAIRTADGDLYSVHAKPGDGWRGGVAYNDNHVVFESTHVLTTRFGVSPQNLADDLFAAESDGDAYLIHSGNN